MTESAAPEVPARRRRLVPLLISAAVVAVLVYLLVRFQGRAENAAANLVALLPLGFAFAAGMVASVNPCGFLMLPSYLAYHLGTESAGGDAAAPARMLQGLLLGAVATAGFIVVSAAVGAVVAAGGQWLIRVFPYASAGVGVVMIGLGGWLLVSNREIGLLMASRVHVTPRRSLGNVFLFGMAYSIGSLSCTLPIFLVVVGSALATQGLIASFGQFISYALGMGVILMAVSVAAALFRGALVRGLRALIPHLHRASALFLMAAGGYLVYYWLLLVP